MKTTHNKCCTTPTESEEEIGYDMFLMQKEYYCTHCQRITKKITYTTQEWNELRPWQEIQ